MFIFQRIFNGKKISLITKKFILLACILFKKKKLIHNKDINCSLHIIHLMDSGVLQILQVSSFQAVRGGGFWVNEYAFGRFLCFKICPQAKKSYKYNIQMLSGFIFSQVFYQIIFRYGLLVPIFYNPYYLYKYCTVKTVYTEP